MAGSVWPTLVAGNKAKASEVESKFDWIEGTLLPMNGGSTTDAAYDIGSSTYRWNNGYFKTEVYINSIPQTVWVMATGLIGG